MDFKDWLGEDNTLGLDIINKKYPGNGEGLIGWLDRVCGGNKALMNLVLEKKFLPAGRILAGRGMESLGYKMEMSNCHVNASPEDNIEGIFDCAKEMARTYSYGGGVGIDISKLSPKGTKVYNAARESSGAVSWMDLYSCTTGLVGQNNRRGALMITMSSDHPDIEDFIDVKRNLDKVTKANISVRMSDEFLRKAELGEDYEATFTRESTGETVSKTLNAKKILRRIAENNHLMGEPGALFWDRILGWHLNSNNPEYKICSTNPCGEQPLSEYSSCLLGSLNLAEFVKDGDFQFDEFGQAVKIAVEGLNEILDEGIPLLPLEKQKAAARDWRNIGLGIMGLADALIKMKIRYGSKEAVEISEMIASHMAKSAITISLELAMRDGAFPKCEPEKIVETPFFKNLYDEEEDFDFINLVKKYGLRNCALLTIAPTGTLSTMLRVSGGIEPIFSYSYIRKTESLNNGEEPVYYKVYTPIVQNYMETHDISDEKDLPEYFVSAHDITPLERIAMQAAWQKYIDASISSTVNLPNSATIDEIYDIYIEAWKAGLKGITVYRDGCARTGILTTAKKENLKTEKEIMEEKPVEAPKEVPPLDTNNTIGLQRHITTGCGTLHMCAYFDRDTGKFINTYFPKGSTGGCMSNITAVSRLVTTAARYGAPLAQIIDDLDSCPTCASYAVRRATKKDVSPGSCCPVAMGKALLDMQKEINDILKDKIVKPTVIKKETPRLEPSNEPRCPECNEPIVFEGGCNVCKNCGWSACS